MAHMVTHSGVKRFKCEICEKSFGLNGNLKDRMRVHGAEKRFKCDICENRFRLKAPNNHINKNTTHWYVILINYIHTYVWGV